MLTNEQLIETTMEDTRRISALESNLEAFKVQSKEDDNAIREAVKHQITGVMQSVNGNRQQINELKSQTKEIQQLTLQMSKLTDKFGTMEQTMEKLVENMELHVEQEREINQLKNEWIEWKQAKRDWKGWIIPTILAFGLGLLSAFLANGGI